MKRTVGWIIVFAFLVTGKTLAVEEARYTVVLKDHSFEVRQYAPHVLAETVVEGNMKGAGNKAFRPLFRYIDGDNTRKEKVAMTAPVSQAAAGEKIAMTAPVGQQARGDQWVVSFMMPSSYTLDTLPEPNDPAVTLREVPEHYMAAIRYSGFWSEKSYKNKLQGLQTWMEERELNAIGEPVWARYNPPFTPWFLRRNEILIPIDKIKRVSVD